MYRLDGGSGLLDQTADAPDSARLCVAGVLKTLERANAIASDDAIAADFLGSARGNGDNRSATVLLGNGKHLVADVTIGHNVVA